MKFKFGDKRKKGITSFEKILPDIIREYELEKSFTIEELISRWRIIVGDIISTHSKPDRIFKKYLIIAVDHSVYANEIMMMKDVIIKKINLEFSFDMITDFKIEIKKIMW